jgi:hypothetical protein
MSLKQYLLQGVAATACLVQVGCETGGPPVDLRNPTVAELDAADVSWGLAPRKEKGAPKRAYQYQVDDSGGGGGAAAAPAPVASAPSRTAEPQAPANPIPAAPDPPQIDVNKLR